MKRKADEAGEIRPEYDFSGGVRGKYAERYASGTKVVMLDPGVAEVSRDPASPLRPGDVR